MKLAYVAGPYRAASEHQVKINIDEAEKVALMLWNMGYAVICPHKNTAFFGGAAPDSVWLTGDIVMLKRCDLIVTTWRWQESTGAKDEVMEAAKANIPWFHYNQVKRLKAFVKDETEKLVK